MSPFAIAIEDSLRRQLCWPAFFQLAANMPGCQQLKGERCVIRGHAARRRNARVVLAMICIDTRGSNSSSFPFSSGKSVAKREDMHFEDPWNVCAEALGLDTSQLLRAAQGLDPSRGVLERMERERRALADLVAARPTFVEDARRAHETFANLLAARPTLFDDIAPQHANLKRLLVASAAQGRALQPIEHKYGPLNPANLAKLEVELILAFVGGELAQHRRGQDGACLQRGDDSGDLVPVLADNIDLHSSAYQRLERRVLSGRLDAGHAAIGKVAQARAKAKTQNPAQREDVIGRAAGVGVMRVDLEPGTMMKQAVEDEGASCVAAEMTVAW